ncbi:MAG: acetyl-CoA carboxylase biotin carboxyl carrier protein [Alphaproteobacteria bacterium]|nr:acetyl-CoA carboxylase biotin carboxyl carrier protein [Alphaproteobacteria bacterium]MCZ6838500.1 acetyl-CoA carboxylase biotin carboxyl carrier protein [Alphaproteobacteria bacterium]
MDDKFDVDADLVRKLAELLAETGLGEIEYEDAGKRIRVAMPGAAPANVSTAPITVPAASEGNATDSQSPDVMNHPGAVTSPMVGTIYMSPAPGEPPFVRPGETVDEGQTILVVEAMKTFNEIAAPCSGKLSRIIVADGQPVEYGEILALIE